MAVQAQLKPTSMIQRALQTDGVVSTLSGLIFTFGAGILSPIVGVEQPEIVLIFGLLIVLYGVGVFTLSNPGHLLAGIGVALVAIGLAGALAILVLEARGIRPSSTPARLGVAGAALALALVAGGTGGAGVVPGRRRGVACRHRSRRPSLLVAFAARCVRSGTAAIRRSVAGQSIDSTTSRPPTWRTT